MVKISAKEGIITELRLKPVSNFRGIPASERKPQKENNRKENNCKTLESLIGRYFRGENVDFNEIPVDMSGYSAFQKSVLMECRNIPRGRLATYKELAKRIGRPKAYRAVGNALKKNRTPIIIPCHRVVKADGDMGGFSCGARWKKILQHIENTQFTQTY